MQCLCVCVWNFLCSFFLCSIPVPHSVLIMGCHLPVKYPKWRTIIIEIITDQHKPQPTKPDQARCFKLLLYAKAKVKGQQHTTTQLLLLINITNEQKQCPKAVAKIHRPSGAIIDQMICKFLPNLRWIALVDNNASLPSC